MLEDFDGEDGSVEVNEVTAHSEHALSSPPLPLSCHVLHYPLTGHQYLQEREGERGGGGEGERRGKGRGGGEGRKRGGGEGRGGEGEKGRGGEGEGRGRGRGGEEEGEGCSCTYMYTDYILYMYMYVHVHAAHILLQPLQFLLVWWLQFTAHCLHNTTVAMESKHV